MSILSRWIDNITVSELLDDAPHGFLSGCGGTSEFLNYLFRIRPEKDLYREICRQHHYFDSAIEIKSFAFDEVDKFMNCIEERLNLYQYVTISFDNNGYPIPLLFDHSFIITKDKWRYESYLGYYGPRRVYWENYKRDIQELFDNPLEKWEQLFNVTCRIDYDPSKIILIVNN
jgi:hypothetical protein